MHIKKLGRACKIVHPLGPQAQGHLRGGGNVQLAPPRPKNNKNTKSQLDILIIIALNSTEFHTFLMSNRRKKPLKITQDIKFL